MLTVYDVHIELQMNADNSDLSKLRDHFKALSINVIGLEADDFRARSDELKFSIYGNLGPFMMKRIIQECTQNIFPGSVVAISDCG